jgi:hypothetical protein
MFLIVALNTIYHFFLIICKMDQIEVFRGDAGMSKQGVRPDTNQNLFADTDLQIK